MIPKNLLPEGYNYFIAGGWAVCPGLADDRDLFVQTLGGLDDARTGLLVHMKDQGFDVVEETTPPKEDDNPYPNTVLKVGTVRVKFARDIRVMVTSADVVEVLNSFDLSICQIAITNSGRIVRGDNYTFPAQPIEVLKNTPTTPARLEKYEARFARG